MLRKTLLVCGILSSLLYQPITVYLSLNFLAEQGLAVGSRLPLKVLPERMRFF